MWYKAIHIVQTITATYSTYGRYPGTLISGISPVPNRYNVSLLVCFGSLNSHIFFNAYVNQGCHSSEITVM